MKYKTAAIIYDFDGTLAPGKMQDHRFIPAVGCRQEEFWDEVNRVTDQDQTEPTLAYMLVMLQKAREARSPIRYEDLREKGQELKYFPGVEDWFARMTGEAAAKGLRLEHYVISSGNEEIIQGTGIAREFKRIYASRFLYDGQGQAIWPAAAVNFTTKTQYLFRINNQALDINDSHKVNRHVAQDQRKIPFKRMAYIGDGETDVPCFRVMKDMGGLSIAVYEEDRRDQAQEYLSQGRVQATAPADYQEGRKLERLIKAWMELAAE